MASVVLPVVASVALPSGTGAAAAAIATTSAAAIGAMLDSRVIMPALFPTQTPHQIGERLTELDLQSASEGSEVKRCFGPDCRSKGTVIWLSEMREVENTERVEGGGGKGGGGSSTKVTTYTYEVDVAIAISGRQAIALTKLLGDSKVVWDAWNLGDGANVLKAGPSTVIAADEITETVPLSRTKGVLFGFPSTARYRYSLRLTADSGGPDLSVFKPGLDLTISGFSNAENNGTFPVTRAFANDDGTTTVEVFLGSDTGIVPSGSQGADEAKGASVTLTQTVPEESEDVTEITFYPGSETQDPDPLMEDAEGIGNVPAFRGTCYVVIESLQLDEFGRRLPQFSFFLEADESIEVGEIIEDILTEAGLTAAQVDASACTDTVRGYVSSGPHEGLSKVRTLMTAFDLVAREVAGTLEFLPRTSLPEVTVDEDDLAAFEAGSGSGTPRPLKVTDVPDASLPSEVAVTFLDSEFDQQTGNQRVRLLGAPWSKGGTQTLSLPVVLSPDEAREIATRLLYVQHTARRTATLSLPPSYVHLIEGDILSFTAFGHAMKVLATRIDRGVNGVIVVEGPVLDADALLQTQATGQSSSAATERFRPIHIPAPLALELIDIAPFRSAHVDRLGYYLACCAKEQDATWRGASVYISNDGTSWRFLAPFLDQAVMGRAVGALATGPVGYWDRAATVTVDMLHGTLSSATETEVLNGENWAVLGNELIAFQTATLVAARRYTLSGLLRGLLNTEDVVDDHAAGDRFILLTGGAIRFQGMQRSDLGQVRYFRAVPSAGSPDDANVESWRLLGNTVRPFTPAHITGERDGSDNLTISWTPRSREPFTVFGPLETPPALSEEYEVDILDGSTVVRTIEVSGARTASYTAAQQTTDGLTPGDPVSVKVYEMSTVVGRGRPGEATV